jgi:hypothetical protein
MTDTQIRMEALLQKWQESPFFIPDVQTIDIEEEHSQTFAIGPIALVLEDRRLDEQILGDHWDKMGRDDTPSHDTGGPSFHVVDSSTGHEYLRFDCFPEFLHYHYLVPGLTGVPRLRFDPVANGDMVHWVLRTLRHRLPQMLEAAGAFHLVDKVHQEELNRVLAEVAAVVGVSDGALDNG